MPVSREFLDFLLDQLSALGSVSVRRMFGSAGLYQDGRMFALVSGENRLYVKADAMSRARFEAAGCRPFTYAVAGRPDVIMSYFAPPETVLDEKDELLAWARLGLEAAARIPEKHLRKKGVITRAS